MLNYKRFFRKRTTRIYLIVLSIIFSLIFILAFFTNYFDNKLKDTYKNNYSLLIVSSNDYYKEIKNNKSVDEIEEILLVKPSELNAFYNYEWDDISLICDGIANGLVIVKKDKTLNNSEIKLGMPFDIDDLEGNIVSKYNSIFYEVSISNDYYENLSSNNILYSYKLSLLNTKEIDDLVSKIKDEDYNSTVLLKSKFSSEKENNYYMNIEKIITSLKYINMFIVFISIFIIIITFRNIIKDDYEFKTLEKYLGFSKKQILFQNMFQIILLLFISVLVSFIISNILFYIFINLF